MCQAVLSANLTKKFQKEVSQMADNRFPHPMPVTFVNFYRRGLPQSSKPSQEWAYWEGPLKTLQRPLCKNREEVHVTSSS